MLLLIVDSNITVPDDFIFSLILSKITIVSFKEYPTIVKKAATVLSVISKPVREKIPNVITTSWTRAKIAPKANLNSNLTDI